MKIRLRPRARNIAGVFQLAMNEWRAISLCVPFSPHNSTLADKGTRLSQPGSVKRLTEYQRAAGKSSRHFPALGCNESSPMETLRSLGTHHILYLVCSLMIIKLAGNFILITFQVLSARGQDLRWKMDGCLRNCSTSISIKTGLINAVLFTIVLPCSMRSARHTTIGHTMCLMPNHVMARSITQHGHRHQEGLWIGSISMMLEKNGRRFERRGQFPREAMFGEGMMAQCLKILRSSF